EDSIEYPTSGGDDDADDDGDDLSEDDADDEDEEESSNSEEEEEEHLALTVLAPALYSSVSAFEETEPFEEGETVATPPPFGYRVAARISVQPHILMPFRSESEIRPALTIADKRRADDRLIGRLRKERRYFRTLSSTYAHERDVSTLQRQYIDDEDRLTRHIQHEHAQRDVAPEDGDTPTATTTTITEAQLQALIDQGVAAAMVEAEASRVRNDYGSNGSGPRLAQTVRECTYPYFLRCQPLNFKGTEGVIGLTQWFEKMESVFNFSNYTSACQVKYAACTVQGVTLTWWNYHVKTVTLEVAQTLPWKTLKKMMTDKYCPRGKIKKLETEMWELKTKGTDVIGYSRRFQELALMCDRTFLEESDRVEKYIG
nr:hypothetical protein [Tanacetum cinerariifolium]